MKLRNDLEGTTSKRVRRRSLSRDRTATNLLKLIAAHYDLPVGVLCARSRGRVEVARARQVAMYLLHVVLGRPMPTVARYFRRHRSSVTRACGAIEDLRDIEALDCAIAAIEAKILAANENRPRREAGRAAA